MELWQKLFTTAIVMFFCACFVKAVSENYARGAIFWWWCSVFLFVGSFVLAMFSVLWGVWA